MKGDASGKVSGAKKMTTNPLRWPNNAAEARDRSAEEAAAIVKWLAPLLDDCNDPNVLRRVSKALYSAHEILRHLEKQGAQTRPT